MQLSVACNVLSVETRPVFCFMDGNSCSFLSEKTNLNFATVCLPAMGTGNLLFTKLQFQHVSSNQSKRSIMEIKFMSQDKLQPPWNLRNSIRSREKKTTLVQEDF